MGECPCALNEAKEIVVRVVEQAALPVSDFFHRATSNSKAATAKPHTLRVLLFNSAGCTHEALCKFDQLVRLWVRNSRSAMDELRAAAAMLIDVQHFVDLDDTARCLAVEASLTRVYLECHGKVFIKLYRGLRLKRRHGKTKKLEITRHSAESHTTSLIAARAFGASVLRDTVPAFRVLACCQTNSVFLPYEHEFIVLRDTSTATTTAVRSSKGFKERLLTAAFGGSVFTVCHLSQQV